jgi:hypothetical protein
VKITDDIIDDDAADTLRFTRLDLDDEVPSDPDATSIYDLRAAEAPPLRAVIAVSEVP